ncbi:MAG: DUF302 domain-containing protein [Bacteroidota bacterium]|nr:DUF302 domain-containing protein [Bacteroidota bacterium]
MEYGFSKTVSLTYEKAIEKVTEELKKEGFGILTSIDVKETLKKKLNVDFQKYIILGACNPTFAHKALLNDEQIGLLLPCNIIVYEKDGKTHVSIFDPMIMMKIMEDEVIRPIAEEVKKKLDRVLDAI